MTSFSTRRRRAMVAAVAAATVSALGMPAASAAEPPGPRIPSSATGASVAVPTVTGPIARTSAVGDPAHGYPFLTTDVPLAEHGYVEEEFFISGQATRYTASGTATATAVSSGHPYTTRIVVRRPVDAADFNGAVIAEWYNVSNQWDQEVDWFQSHEHLIREGYAWVGISAQRAGVHNATTGLRAWSPTRYGSLDVTAGGTITDDSLSYDIFSQGVKAVRAGGANDPMDGLDVEYVIGTGHSQSAGRLANYYNGIQPLSNILDAVVLHGGGGVLRTDSSTPVFRINSEGDVASGILSAAARQQPESAVLRSWEVSGASHGDWKLITDYGPLRFRDVGSYPGGFPGTPNTCALPSLSRIPQHMVQNAVYDHTLNWVAHGILPPTAPQISMTDTTPPQVARDELGIGLGGIRLSQQEVPTRINSGSNTGPGFCFLDGSSLPIDDAALAAMYPSQSAYVDEVVAVTRANVEAGYISESFMQDAAWYSDLDYLIGDYLAADRLAPHVAASLRDRLDRAERLALQGSETRAAGYVQQLLARINNQVKGDADDALVRASLARQAAALVGLLELAEDREAPAA
jgi:hypothetical protein